MGKFPDTFVSNLILTISGIIIDGFSFENCVVPPKPVTLQKRSYNGTDANDKPSIRKNINTNSFGFIFTDLFIIMAYLIFRCSYCTE